MKRDFSTRQTAPRPIFPDIFYTTRRELAISIHQATCFEIIGQIRTNEPVHSRNLRVSHCDAFNISLKKEKKKKYPAAFNAGKNIFRWMCIIGKRMYIKKSDATAGG